MLVAGAGREIRADSNAAKGDKQQGGMHRPAGEKFSRAKGGFAVSTTIFFLFHGFGIFLIQKIFYITHSNKQTS